MDRLAVADILDRAATLLEPAGAWTQKGFARDANGGACEARDPHAVCWCAAGALERASAPLGAVDGTDLAYNALLKVVGGAYVSDWNDGEGRTQREVVQALRFAARREREAAHG